MPHLADCIRYVIRLPSNKPVLEVKRNGEWVPVPHVTVWFDHDGEEIDDGAKR